MAHFTSEQKLSVLYECNPLFNGINPSKDLSNIRSIIEKSQKVYFRAIKDLGLENVVDILEYLIKSDTYTKITAAVEVLPDVRKNGSPTRRVT